MCQLHIRILLLIVYNVIERAIGSPGKLAGESGPVRGVLALAGEPAGEGEGPRIPGRWGDV